MTISLVAAMAENRVIGKQGKIPWHIPGEQKIFRRLTIFKFENGCDCEKLGFDYWQPSILWLKTSEIACFCVPVLP